MMAVGLLVAGLFLVATVFAGKSSSGDQSTTVAAAAEATPPRVLGIEKAEGVSPRVWSALLEWNAGGPFVVQVNEGGGLRAGDQWAAWQLRKFNEGASKADTLEKTAHGRGGAVDLGVVLNGIVQVSQEQYDNSPTVQRMYSEMGEWFKQRGFRWGGDFPGFADVYHVEQDDWRSLPFPPVAGVA